MRSPLLAASLLALTLAGCRSLEDPGAHVAGFTLVDPTQRHPIMVSQQPSTTVVHVARGSEGLSPGQTEEIDRVTREHADLSDDAFVAANLDKWLA